jgi:hypothetical protein
MIRTLEQIPPDLSLSEGGNDLAESLAWLLYCLGETEAALAAVKEGSLEAMKSSGKPVLLGQVKTYHKICEAAAGIITLKGRVSRWPG